MILILLKFNDVIVQCHVTISVFCTANCGYPLQASGHEFNNSLRITGYEPPMLVGSNISLSCHPEYVLIGPNISTCLENGEWVPDPKEVQCGGVYTGPYPDFELGGGGFFYGEVDLLGGLGVCSPSLKIY